MPWNGSGTFNRIYSWVADKAAGLDISSSRMDTDTNDLATNGFGNCLTRDGQGQPTANLPMSNFRHTGVGNGVVRTDYAALGQVQDGSTNWTTAGGTSDALTATFTPALTTLIDGQICFVRAAAANAGTTPTFAPNGLTAHTITRYGGAAVVPGDIAGANAELVLRYNLANTRWELLNPANPIPNATIGGTSAVTLSAGTTAQRPGSPVVGMFRYNTTVGAAEAWDPANSAWQPLSSPNASRPSITQLIAASGTYSTPTGATCLIVEMIGGGGGGAGNGTGAVTAGSGGDSSFGSVVAKGGVGGTAATTSNGQPGGAGGSGGAGSAVRCPGGAGNPGGNASASVSPPGGSGGNGFFGGGGASGTTTINPVAGQAQTGGGGGGAGSPNSSFGAAGGGGAGEYARFSISNPAASYSYSVGAAGSAGAAGTGGASGSTGGAGQIIVTALFP